MRFPTATAILLALSACATPPAGQPPRIAPTPQPPTVTRIVPGPVHDPVEAPATSTAPRDLKAEDDRAATMSEAVQVNTLQLPDPGQFLGQVLTYPYSSTLPYRIYACIDGNNVGMQTYVDLAPGEHLNKIVDQGGGMLFFYSYEVQGTGKSARVRVFVKPKFAGKETRVMLVTDMPDGGYDLRIKSYRQKCNAGVRFTYGEQQLSRLNKALAEDTAERSAKHDEADSGLNVDDSWCKYEVSGDTDEIWAPVKTRGGMPPVCDGVIPGGQTITRINFAPTIGATEAPTILDVDDQGVERMIRAVEWHGTMLVFPGQHRKIRLRISGRYIDYDRISENAPKQAAAAQPGSRR